MNDEIAELIEKYQDGLECADTWEEKNIYSEILDDLRRLVALQ